MEQLSRGLLGMKLSYSMALIHHFSANSSNGIIYGKNLLAANNPVDFIANVIQSI
jgi:hypothetical protein